jgi:hypothetical protein
MTFTEYQDKARTARERAERISKARMDTARAASIRAGLGTYMGNVIHNALLAREQGRPWTEVNYSEARRAQREADRSHEPFAILSRWHDRVFKTVTR